MQVLGASPGLICWGAVGIALHIGLARFTYGVMLPAIQRDLGLAYLGSGSLNAVHLAGYLIGTLTAPWLIARMGVAKLSVRAHLLVAAGAMLCAAAPGSALFGPAVLGLGRLATGLGAGGAIVAIFVIVFAAVTAAQRPLVSAVVWSGMGAAIVASGLAIVILLEGAHGWRMAFGFSALLALAVAFFFPSRRAWPRDAVKASGTGSAAAGAGLASGWALAWRQWCLIASYLMFGVAYIAYATFAGAQLAAMQAPVFVAGVVWVSFGCTAMLGAALTVPVLRSPRMKQSALVAAMGFGAVGALVAGMDTAQSALAGALLVGLGLAATPTIVSARVRDRCSVHDYPVAFSLATAGMGIGQLIGPVAGGLLADRFGPGVVPLFAAAAYGVGALLAWVDALQPTSSSP